MTNKRVLMLLCIAATLSVHSIQAAQRYTEQRQPCTQYDENRRAFFGDLHVHTRYSLDASTQGTRTTPQQAYEFARGARLGIQPWSEAGKPLRSLQLARPLDFAMVSDHAELIGEVRMCNTPDVEGYSSWQCLLYRHVPRAAYYLFNYMATMQQTHLGMCGENGEHCKEVALVPWAEMQSAAERAYDRSEACSFTSFVGYEWTAMEVENGGNLHRNVVFRNAEVPRLPPDFIDNPAASKLWKALDLQCIEAEGRCDALVIPHNSNLSAGYMFSGELDGGGLMTPDYARTRARFEPLVEVMQHKGASECFYDGGTGGDELCAFEQQPTDNIAVYKTRPARDTGFVREALADGLAIEEAIGVNPYRFGMIGSTDTHLGAPGAISETGFPGHGGAGTPARDAIPSGLPDKLEYNPGGLAVVWAQENTRDSLFAAMRRREAYATSGPRITSRFFAGWNYPGDLCAQPDRISQAYAGGVPMGGELRDRGASGAPVFMLAASQDAGTGSAPGMALQRIQLIKGWIDEAGTTHHRVFDVAGDPDNGAGVNLDSCEVHGDGFAQLCSVWQDPDFNPQQSAFYYTRVLENPSCRWSQRQCIDAGVDCDDPATISDGYAGCCAPKHQPVIQERAWSSPIWYLPEEGQSPRVTAQ